ncbi:flagellar basal body protein FliL [Sphingomonas sp. Leaf339]|uniref:flagellar basal body-associated FliL family protein n=1 Tax=Sphingomonas sp. Leaf339 TaxID=1736343 RepID=UPI0006FFB689|nr:flagellar basal body-associated FliL family protein [Sphingomonas sp. Leaf339]KQU61553.1 flagellar basal body protein FliL [Sphingomonas sp. Leaf339]
MSDAKDDAGPPKKGGKKKLLMGAAALIVLIGGGVGAGVYAAQSGMIGGGKDAHAKVDNGPKLVPKSEQKHGAAEGGEGGEGGEGHGSGDDAEAATGTDHKGTPTPEGQGGDKYASNYYAMDKEFTSNLQDSMHFIQVGVAVSTSYDDKVIQNLKTNDIAVRSAVLMTLGDTTEDQVFSADGKRQLQARLVKAINATLQQKEGFGGIGNVYFTSFVVQ